MRRNASELLRSEHRQVEDHLDNLLSALKHLSVARVNNIRDTVGKIADLVGVHMEIEERVFYPAIQSFADDLLPRMLRQHEEIRETNRYLEELLAIFPDVPSNRDLSELYRLGIEFHDAIQVHIVEEEDQLLRRAEEQLSIQQQQRLFAEMQKLEG